jgi:hypothetical protein
MENPIIYILISTMENQHSMMLSHGERMEQQRAPWRAMINKFMVNLTEINITLSKIIELRRKTMAF